MVDFAKLQRQKQAEALRSHLLGTNDGVLPTGVPGAIVMGQIASLRGQGEDGEWVVGDLLDEQSGVRVPFVGSGLGGLQVGQGVRLVGEWKMHGTYGLQFAAETVQQHLPTTPEGIARWLAQNVPGCGAGSAQKLVSRWGDNTLAHLLEHPHAVRDVIPGKAGKKIEGGLREAQVASQQVAAERSVSVRLLSAGFTSHQIGRLLKHFRGAAAVEKVVLTRPYDLTQVSGIGFLTADRMARGMGVDRKDPLRLAAGVLHVVLEAQGQGDSLLSESEVIRRARRVLGVEDNTLLTSALVQAEKGGTLVRREARPEDDVPTRWMTSRAHAAEERVSEWVVKMLQNPLTETLGDDRLAEIAAAHNLTDPQADALKMALTKPLSILTGLPGAGKTTTVKAICRAVEESGLVLGIAAPTGKAAARAQAVTGAPASTIHRLLVAAERDKTTLDLDLLVVDEVSMQDVELTARLTRVLDPQRTRVLLVGDHNQLPSVAHGQVLRDLLDVERIPRVRLTEILRQESKASVGVQNSHRLLAGKPMMINNSKDSDFWFADVTDEGEVDSNGWPIAEDEDRSRREQEAAQARILEAVRFLMSDPTVEAARDIQVLTPMKARGPLGAKALNDALQEVINPKGAAGPQIGAGAIAHVGDRLMQVDRNNYEVEGFLCNGEQGVVIDVTTRSLTLDLGDRTVQLQEAGHLRNLQPAWAITTHRSQGSEFRFVISPLHTAHFVMLKDPSLFYTALTRFKERVVIVGSQRMLTLLERFSRKPLVRGTGLVESIETRLQAVDLAPREWTPETDSDGNAETLLGDPLPLTGPRSGALRR